MLRLLPLIFLALPALAFADEGDLRMRLTVKPVLCIVDQRTPTCDMSFLVVWHSRDSGYYCVFNDIEPEPLRCWADKREGDLVDERSVTSNFDYLINQGSDTPRLAVVSVEVLRMDSDDRRRRRRTRHIWDLL